MQFNFLNWVQLSGDFGKVVLSGTTQGKVCHLGYSKVHNCFLVKAFLTNILHLCSFFLIYRILNSNIRYPKQKPYTKMHVYLGTDRKSIHVFHHQKFSIIYLVHIYY